MTNTSNSSNSNNSSNSSNTRKCSNSNSWCQSPQSAAKEVQWTNLNTNGTSSNNMTKWWVTPSTQHEATPRCPTPTPRAASQTKQTKRVSQTRLTTRPERMCHPRCSNRCPKACTILSRFKWEIGPYRAHSILIIRWRWIRLYLVALAVHMLMAVTRWVAPICPGIWIIWVSRQILLCN